jgi:endonuclease/exonuclease/phosphatase (EEP) superfamily protein YafD
MHTRLFRIASRSYLTGVALWAALFALVADRPWWMFIATSFGPWLFAPVPLLLILAWKRDRRSWWGALGLAGLALCLWGPLFLPRSSREEAPPAGGSRLTVLSFNVLYANKRLDQIPDLLAASGADVIVLQELRPDSARFLRQALADIYPYSVVDEEQQELRPGILSKYPLTDAASPPELGWGVCTARLWLDGHPVRLVGVHYPVSFLRRIKGRSAIRLVEDTVVGREEQATALLRFLRQHSEPAVVAGDFNSTPLSGLHRILTEGGLRDSWKEAGFGFGHTWSPEQPLPFARIDYVWVTPHWTVAAAEVRPWDGGSDHRGVRVELRLSERSPELARSPQSPGNGAARRSSAPSSFPGPPGAARESPRALR